MLPTDSRRFTQIINDTQTGRHALMHNENFQAKNNPSKEQFTMGSSGSRLTYNKSSSGLSGGAIAGIVIACVVALIATAVAVIMLKKPSPPVENTTTVANLQTENL